MSGGFARSAPRRAGWRTLAALAAAVAIVTLVHWHPLFEDSGSETLRDAANQCAACTAGSGAPAIPAVTPTLVPVESAVVPPPAEAPAAPVRHAAPPRAPPA